MIRKCSLIGQSVPQLHIQVQQRIEIVRLVLLPRLCQFIQDIIQILGTFRVHMERPVRLIRRQRPGSVIGIRERIHPRIPLVLRRAEIDFRHEAHPVVQRHIHPRQRREPLAQGTLGGALVIVIPRRHVILRPLVSSLHIHIVRMRHRIPEQHVEPVRVPLRHLHRPPPELLLRHPPVQQLVQQPLVRIIRTQGNIRIIAQPRLENILRQLHPVRRIHPVEIPVRRPLVHHYLPVVRHLRASRRSLLRRQHDDPVRRLHPVDCRRRRIL